MISFLLTNLVVGVVDPTYVLSSMSCRASDGMPALWLYRSLLLCRYVDTVDRFGQCLFCTVGAPATLAARSFAVGQSYNLKASSSMVDNVAHESSVPGYRVRYLTEITESGLAFMIDGKYLLLSVKTSDDA